MSNHRLPSSYEFSRGSKPEISFSLPNVILSGIFGTKSCIQRSIAKAVASSTKWWDWARQDHVYDIVMQHHGLSQEENICIDCDLGLLQAASFHAKSPWFQRMAQYSRGGKKSLSHHCPLMSSHTTRIFPPQITSSSVVLSSKFLLQHHIPWTCPHLRPGMILVKRHDGFMCFQQNLCPNSCTQNEKTLSPVFQHAKTCAVVPCLGGESKQPFCKLSWFPRPSWGRWTHKIILIVNNFFSQESPRLCSSISSDAKDVVIILGHGCYCDTESLFWDTCQL